MKRPHHALPGRAMLLLLAASCNQVGPAKWPLKLEAQPVSFSMPVPERIRQAAERASNASPLSPICFMRFQQVTLAPGRSAQLRIFFNTPQANIATSTENPGYAGFLVVSPPPQAEGHPQPLNLTLDVTSSQASALRRDELTLTLVPLGEPGGSIEGLDLKIGEVRFFMP